jgi:hypothetical protein
MSFNVIWSEHFSLSHFAWELSGSTGCGNDNVNRLKQTMGIILSINKIFYYFGERQSRNDFVISKIISANFVSGNWILT